MTLAKFSTTMSPGRSILVRHARTTRAHGRYQPTERDFIGSFQAVLDRWRSETVFLSNPDDITGHPSYRALVQNAQVAAPLIFSELRKGPSLLVWVLDDAFPGEHPYPDDKAGNIAEMTKAWLDWGEQHGRAL